MSVRMTATILKKYAIHAVIIIILTTNVAIDDVLPIKAARPDAIANLKSFWGFWTSAT